MTVGVEPCQADLFKGSRFVGDRVAGDSVFSVLFREGVRLFPGGMFDDLFSPRGRRSVPPRVVATVMVLQRYFGFSDREAVAAFEFDLRWRYACGGLDSDGGGFCHTVLVGMRARLAASDRPRRIFEAVLEVARSAGALSQNRVLDSAPIYDAVATQDTVTMLRAAIRGVLEAAGDAEGAVRGLLAGGDGYASRSKPACDWADAHAREALVARIAADADAVLGALEGRALSVELAQAAQLLAAVVGQDLREDPEGRFQIARRVARDRIISVVDRDARHGHKTAARGFDGYKGHIATDPDSELITATAVTAANAPDARPAPELIADLLDTTADTDTDPPDTGADPLDTDTDPLDTDTDPLDTGADARPAPELIADSDTTADSDSADSDGADAAGVVEDFAGRPTVYGDCAYGSGDFQSLLSEHRINSKCRTQAPHTPGGRFAKDRFSIDLRAATVTCPAEVTVAIRFGAHGAGTARFGDACTDCELRDDCTEAKAGRTIRIGTNEAVLAASRARQRDPAWRNDYRATRPKVERKLAHLMRRKHGGRHARVRGQPKVDADFNLLAAAANIARLGALGLHSTPNHWALT